MRFDKKEILTLDCIRIFMFPAHADFADLSSITFTSNYIENSCIRGNKKM